MLFLEEPSPAGLDNISIRDRAAVVLLGCNKKVPKFRSGIRRKIRRPVKEKKQSTKP